MCLRDPEESRHTISIRASKKYKRGTKWLLWLEQQLGAGNVWNSYFCIPKYWFAQPKTCYRNWLVLTSYLLGKISLLQGRISTPQQKTYTVMTCLPDPKAGGLCPPQGQDMAELGSSPFSTLYFITSTLVAMYGMSECLPLEGFHDE